MSEYQFVHCLAIDGPRVRAAYRAELRVRDPICGPVALGHSCHFGLGQFVPQFG
jgi:hypothetical protein